MLGLKTIEHICEIKAFCEQRLLQAIQEIYFSIGFCVCQDGKQPMKISSSSKEPQETNILVEG